ncbi:hypothetical protein E1J38_013405 [Seonamhaeicola sediminis]|uniref:Uncharacterized protein n=1 Tax=Seonamhaeicola sediminis TaxID=2528206 RepID=A0A562YAQ7_9FLAO|nr:hypothetical protein [Seonamhaeicola sediminis]TWO31514.1 hypothetical protein E1J38_013405 [Seonamhaeicola sediminis]
MRKLLLFLIFMGHIVPNQSNAQKLKFKEKTVINIAHKANKNFPVVYVPSAKKTKKYNVVFDKKGDTLSYQNQEFIDWKNPILLDSIKAKQNGIRDFTLFGELGPKDGYLEVYFYPFVIEDGFDNDKKKRLMKANKFLSKNKFQIKLSPGQNLGFDYSRFHAGVMTMPFKVYLSSRNSDNSNNVETDAGIGLYLGSLFGTRRYLKLPSEKEYRIYEYGWSINAFAGINKLTIDDKNTLDVNSFQGNLLTSSFGISLGWHYKIFSIFGAFGIDAPLSSNGKDWNFRGKPWLGFGFGFEIL